MHDVYKTMILPEMAFLLLGENIKKLRLERYFPARS